MPTVLRRLFAAFSTGALPAPGRRLAVCSLALLGARVPAVAQDSGRPQPAPVPATAPAAPTDLPPSPAPTNAPVSAPKFLFKSGLRLTHLFYLPDYRSWQLVLPISFGVEYRFRPGVSLLVQAEADIPAGRAPRGRRGSIFSPTPGASLGLGGRYYFNHARLRYPGAPAECWGNYLALETNTNLSAVGRPRGGASGRGQGILVRFTPSLFVLLGGQHAMPGRRLLYDLNAGLGVEAPPPYLIDPGMSTSWNVAAQLNLWVYLVNRRRAAR